VTARGRYRLVGLPKGRAYELTVYPGEGQNYLSAQNGIADSEGLRPLTLDFELRRGVPVRFRLVDRETGKWVHGQVQYEPTADNPYRAEAVFAPGVIPSREFMRIRGTDQDGFIRFVAYPGPGVLFAWAGRGSPPFLRGRLDPADRAKGHYPAVKGDPSNGFLEITHGYRRIDPDQTEQELTFEVALHSGRTVRGTLLGPDGQPVAGATAYGLTFDAAARYPAAPVTEEVLKTEAFTALGLYPGEARTLTFVHKGRKLIGHAVVHGTEEKPVRVMLQPWGAVTGRLVDAEGKPLADVRLRLHYPSLPAPGMRPAGEEFRTDRAGRFRAEGLLPGLEHELTLAGGPGKDIMPSAGEALRKRTARAGEVKDLGDVKVTAAAVKKP
jgi:hypothetical protein